MSKRKRIVRRKTRSPSRSRRSSPGNRRRTKWLAGCGSLCCIIIAILLLARHVRQRNRQPQDALSSLEYREPSAKPRATSTLSPEEQIAALQTKQIELAKNVMRDFPNSGEASVLMGDLHRWLGSSSKAVEFWQKGLELSPRRADVYHRLGTVALERGDFEQAISFWQKALDV
ncbi:MAG: hypothetical protein PVJ86_05710, partial [Phycisphaerales bacterium]